MTPTLRRLAMGAVCSVLALASAACATGLPDVQPADIPRLQSELEATPTDTDVMVQLGMAHFKAGDYDAAEANLQAAIDAGDESGPALLYLGMVNEERRDWPAAREAYTRYLTVGQSSETREEVRKRLTLIGRNILRTQAQQALAQEAEIAGAAQVTPRSVAVLPLGFNSDREDLEPLIYALSDMMTTDFAISNALVVLERSQIQALLDEMALTSSGYAEAQTGARAGRLLRAEHVFQGVLTTVGDDLQTDADVLNVPSTSSVGQLTEEAALDELFDMEKQIVIRTIREVLGVELTPAEEQAILENRMENVLAFLAYGRGLREIDRGNYTAAQAEFQLSIQLEPGSYASRDDAMGEVADLADASSGGTSDLGDVAASTGELGLGVLAPPSFSTTGFVSTSSGATTNVLGSVTENVAPSPSGSLIDLGSVAQSTGLPSQGNQDTRDPVQESSGQETVGGTVDAVIRIVIQSPGGEE